MKLISLTAALLLWTGLIVPEGASAAGGPIPPAQGSYIGVPGSPYRYVAVGAGRDTIVEVQHAGAGAPVSALRLSGRYGIPGVDYSGATTGLSADGRTLVLAELPQSTPPRTTRLVVLDTRRVAVRIRLALPGWSTVDAISPNGRWLYLIHYPSSDISRYEVRAYDLVARRLLPKRVVDPRERGEAMTGFPVGRVMSGDGRWAYTLYLRPSGVPFIHALDTAGLRAVCVDLPSLGNADMTTVHLGLPPGGGTLGVDVDGVTRAVINTHTFAVSAGVHHAAAAPVRPVSPGRRGARGHVDVPWALILLLVAVLGLLGAGARVARSRRHPAYDRDADGAALIYVDARQEDTEPADEEAPVA